MKQLIIGLSVVVAAASMLQKAALAQQPFSNIQSSPTTSPYLTLTNRNGSGNGFAAYQNYVLPQIQQQQVNAQQQQQLQHLQQQQQKTLTGGAGGAPRGISGAIRGTGHITAYMDYLHYYQRPSGGQPQAPRQ